MPFVDYLIASLFKYPCRTWESVMRVLFSVLRLAAFFGSSTGLGMGRNHHTSTASQRSFFSCCFWLAFRRHYALWPVAERPQRSRVHASRRDCYRTRQGTGNSRSVEFYCSLCQSCNVSASRQTGPYGPHIVRAQAVAGHLLQSYKIMIQRDPN